MQILDDDAFGSILFADLDTLTDRDLHDLNSKLAAGQSDVARAEQWRERIADILVSRI